MFHLSVLWPRKNLKFWNTKHNSYEILIPVLYWPQLSLTYSNRQKSFWKGWWAHLKELMIQGRELLPHSSSSRLSPAPAVQPPVPLPPLSSFWNRHQPLLCHSCTQHTIPVWLVPKLRQNHFQWAYRITQCWKCAHSKFNCYLSCISSISCYLSWTSSISHYLSCMSPV